LRGTIEALSVTGHGGAVVAVVGNVAEAELTALARLRGQVGSVTIVQFDRSSWDPLAPWERGGLVGAGLIRVTGERRFADTWNAAFQRGARTAALLGGLR